MDLNKFDQTDGSLSILQHLADNRLRLLRYYFLPSCLLTLKSIVGVLSFCVHCQSLSIMFSKNQEGRKTLSYQIILEIWYLGDIERQSQLKILSNECYPSVFTASELSLAFASILEFPLKPLILWMIYVEPVGTPTIRWRPDRQLPSMCCFHCLLSFFTGWCSGQGGRYRRASWAREKCVNCTEEGVQKWWGIRWLGVSPHFRHWQNATNSDNWKWKTQGTSVWQRFECEIWTTSPGLVSLNAILVFCMHVHLICVREKEKGIGSWKKKALINDFHFSKLFCYIW